MWAAVRGPVECLVRGEPHSMPLNPEEVPPYLAPASAGQRQGSRRMSRRQDVMGGEPGHTPSGPEGVHPYFVNAEAGQGERPRQMSRRPRSPSVLRCCLGWPARWVSSNVEVTVRHGGGVRRRPLGRTLSPVQQADATLFGGKWAGAHAICSEGSSSVIRRRCSRPARGFPANLLVLGCRVGGRPISSREERVAVFRHSFGRPTREGPLVDRAMEDREGAGQGQCAPNPKKARPLLVAASAGRREGPCRVPGGWNPAGGRTRLNAP